MIAESEFDRMADSGLGNKQTKESDQRQKEYTLTGGAKRVAEEYRDYIGETVGPDNS